jgi:hypothetical protein
LGTITQRVQRPTSLAHIRNLQTPLSSSRLLQSYLRSGLVAELRHLHVLDAEPFRSMRRPLHSHLVVQIRPFRVVSLSFTLLGDSGHELPRAVERLEDKLPPQA